MRGKTAKDVQGIIFYIVNDPSLPDCFDTEWHSEFHMSSGRHPCNFIDMLIEKVVSGIVHPVDVFLSLLIDPDVHPIPDHVFYLASSGLLLKYRF